MIIHFQPPVPCAQLTDEGTRCGTLTTTGVIAPTDGDVLELLPVCLPHYQAAVRSFGVDVGRMTPADIRRHCSRTA